MNKIDISDQIVKNSLNKIDQNRKNVLNENSSNITNVKQKNQVPENKKMYDAALDFESIFVYQLLEAMDKTVEKSGFIDGGAGEKIFKSMLNEEYAKNISKQQNFGLADTIYQQLGGKFVTKKYDQNMKTVNINEKENLNKEDE
jgi:flagellar protein FlgJ